MLTSVGRHLVLVGWALTALLHDGVAAGQPLRVRSQPALPANFPAGIYWLGPRERAVPEAILHNPSIRGVVVRMRWPDIEPTEGQFNWGYFEEEIKRAAQWGKAVSLRLPSGGRNTPEWVMKLSGVETFTFRDKNIYHKETTRQEVTIPVFWNPVFLEKKKQLIRAWGARFGTNPQVATVDMACANALTNDWNFPAHTPQEVREWQRLGYTPEKLSAACKELLDETMTAFPGKVVILSIGTIKLDRPQDRVARTIVDYAYGKYPGRFMAIRSNLSAKTPDPAEGRLPGIAQLLFDRRPYTGAQMLLGASLDRHFRMNGGKPGDRREIFQRAMQTGLNYGVSFLEVYQEDLLNPVLADIVAATAAEFSKRKP